MELLLLDDSQTYATESLLQVLNADALLVWAASYQTQHLGKRTITLKHARSLKLQISMRHLTVATSLFEKLTPFSE